MDVSGEAAYCCVGEAGILGIACEVGMLILVPGTLPENEESPSNDNANL